jgi:hypothetical protein
MTKKILVLGATSGIAQAVARRYAAQGVELFLVARDLAKTQAVAADLTARGAAVVSVFGIDLTDSGRLIEMCDAAWKQLGVVDCALIAHGTLPDSSRSAVDLGYLIDEFRTNAESTIACMALLAQRFRAQGSGVIAVMGSVAGDRGRASNYAYGAAKAAVHTFASGLRAQLAPSGIQVLTIKPGFVATQMTASLNLPSALTAQPESVAARIQMAIDKKRDVIYAPGFWWLIMTIIRLLPEALFKRLKF